MRYRHGWDHTLVDPLLPGRGRYLLGGAGHQALVQPQSLPLREALRLIVPHQEALDLCGRRGGGVGGDNNNDVRTGRRRQRSDDEIRR